MTHGTFNDWSTISLLEQGFGNPDRAASALMPPAARHNFALVLNQVAGAAWRTPDFAATK
jgi:hypothetical protein